jgi:uncharacterized SAM-binding protein YcdF (DUF218 family)
VLGFIFLIGITFFVPQKTSSNRMSSITKSNQPKTTRLYDSPQDIPSILIQSLDAILILGGGVPTSIDHPPLHVQRRCDDAIQIFEKRQQLPPFSPSKRSNQRERLYDSSNDLPILCLSAGSAHVPQLVGEDGLPVWESTASASYLAHCNIPPASIFVETTSYDTIGNAYFARTSHTDINGWRNLLVITNEFQMTRTIAIFDWIFSMDNINNSGKKMMKQSYQLYYLQSPNAGLAENVVLARKEREAASTKTLRDVLMPRYTNLQDLYYFLTQDHSMYTAHKLVNRGHGTDSKDASGVSEQVKTSYGGGSSETGAASASSSEIVNEDMTIAQALLMVKTLTSLFGFSFEAANESVNAVGAHDLQACCDYIWDRELGADGGGAIAPIDDCPHLTRALQITSSAIPLDVFGRPCCYFAKKDKSEPSGQLKNDIDESTGMCPMRENWICLSCSDVYCSRYVNGHGLCHWKETSANNGDGHCVLVSLTDLSVWCNVCGAYLIHESLQPIVQRLQQIKFPDNKRPEEASKKVGKSFE